MADLVDVAAMVAASVRWGAVIEFVEQRVLVLSGRELAATLDLYARLRRQWADLPPAEKRRNAVYLDIFGVVGLAKAADAGCVGTTERQIEPPPSHWLTTEQAGLRAGVSESYLRRIAPELGGCYWRGRWYLDPVRVDSYRRRDKERA